MVAGSGVERELTELKAKAESIPARENKLSMIVFSGGLVAMGEKEFRLKSARVKAEQMKAGGAATICTACENCHTSASPAAVSPAAARPMSLAACGRAGLRSA